MLPDELLILGIQIAKEISAIKDSEERRKMADAAIAFIRRGVGASIEEAFKKDYPDG